MQAARLTQPTTAAEPVSVRLAKSFCKVQDDAEDELIQHLISAAREHVERETGLVLASSTWRIVGDAFPDRMIETEEELWNGWREGSAAAVAGTYRARPLDLPLYPIVSVSSFRVDGAEVASDTYSTDTSSRPSRLVPASFWPAVNASAAGIVVEVSAGYTAGNLPASLAQAVLMLVAHWYENREAATRGEVAEETALGLERLLSPWRLVL